MMRLLLLMVVLSGFGITSARAETNAVRFGFSGPEIFPIDNGVSQMKQADLDGDGLLDLLVVNNARSRIQILWNQTGKTNLTAKTVTGARRDINELPPDARFRLDSIASEKRISSMVVADLNNDGKPDIAYYGDPKELVVQYNQGTNGWSAPKRFPIEDGTLDPYALVAGDLNGDKMVDLALLGDSAIYYLAQQSDHTLGEPEKIPYSGTVKSLQILDIQGDGRDDLLLVNWDSPNPFRFRLQDSQGRLGPEIHFTLPPIRSYSADDLDGDRKTEIITIAQKSGRAQVSNFIQKPGDPLLESWAQGQFQVIPLTKTTKAHRASAWLDVNGDKLPDLLTADPDTGQLALYLQKKDGTLEAAKSFPTFTGVSDLAAGDWSGDGHQDIFVLSADERQLGTTRLDGKGRIGFPKSLPLEGRPLAMAFGGLTLNEKPALALIVDLDGKRELQLRTSDGQTRKQKLSESFKSNPASMSILDVNQDGWPDIVLLVPYEKLKILLQIPGKDFEEVDVAAPGGAAEQPWLSAADVDGDGKPELLLAQKNFLRAVVLQSSSPAGQTNKAGWAFTVKEQINGASSSSRIVGAAAVPQTKGRTPALFLLDAERKAITVCDRDKSGLWQVARNIPLPFTDFQNAEAVRFAGTNAFGISLAGVNAIGLLRLQGDVWELSELSGYETPIRDGYLRDLVTGDLNGDGRKELAFLETSKGYVDLVTFEKPHEMMPADRWQVFEERTFRNRRSDNAEPREALIADFTGDGKNDLVLLVHDRVLLYPQE